MSQIDFYGYDIIWGSPNVWGIPTPAKPCAISFHNVYLPCSSLGIGVEVTLCLCKQIVLVHVFIARTQLWSKSSLAFFALKTPSKWTMYIQTIKQKTCLNTSTLWIWLKLLKPARLTNISTGCCCDSAPFLDTYDLSFTIQEPRLEVRLECAKWDRWDKRSMT